MKVMVFGVFDGLHEGHRAFLNFAKEHGQLVVVVARDSVVQKLKNKTAINNENKRVEAIKKFMPQAVVMLGDEEQGSYEVIKKHKPDRIVLGFDQEALRADVQAKHFDIAFIAAKEFNRNK